MTYSIVLATGNTRHRNTEYTHVKQMMHNAIHVTPSTSFLMQFTVHYVLSFWGSAPPNHRLFSLSEKFAPQARIVPQKFVTDPASRGHFGAMPPKSPLVDPQARENFVTSAIGPANFCSKTCHRKRFSIKQQDRSSKRDQVT